MVRCEAELVEACDLRDAGRSETVEAEATGYPWISSWPTMPERDAVPIIRRTASVSIIGASDANLQAEARSWLSGRSEAARAKATAFPWTSWLTMPERDAVPIIRRTASASFVGASDAKLQAEARSWLSEKVVPERDMRSYSAFPWDA